MRRREFICRTSSFLVVPSLAKAPISAIADYEIRSRGRIGLYAQNVKSGAKLAWRANERFVMCSTFKASLAACVLSRVDQGSEKLTRSITYGASDIQDWWAPIAKENLSKGALSVEDMCSAAVRQSDNTCANLLLSAVGGPQALTAFWRRLGDSVTRLDEPEPFLNRTPPGKEENTTTPASMASDLRRLVLGGVLSVRSRALLIEWLVGCETGFNRLRAGLPKDWLVGDKTGNNGADAAGDIAVVWPASDNPIVICAYTRGGAPTDAQLEAAFSGIGRVVAANLR